MWHPLITRESTYLRSKSYAPAADGGVEYAMAAAQAHTGVTVLIETNAREDALIRYRRVIFFLRRQSFISRLLAPALGVNRISSGSNLW